MVKEIEKVLPVVHIATVVPISKTVGANRIVPAVAIPHPLGNPTMNAKDEKELRRALVEKALKAAPENSTALNGLAYILAETDRDLTRSLLLCKKAVEKQPENPAYLDSMALIYHKMDLPSEAESCITRAKEKLPDNKIILKHFEMISSDAREA